MSVLENYVVQNQFIIYGISIWMFVIRFAAKLKVLYISRLSNKGPAKQKVVPEIQPRKLRTLDVFAGCGGLSCGFDQVSAPS